MRTTVTSNGTTTTGTTVTSNGTTPTGTTPTGTTAGTADPVQSDTAKTDTTRADTVQTDIATAPANGTDPAIPAAVTLTRGSTPGATGTPAVTVTRGSIPGAASPRYVGMLSEDQTSTYKQRWREVQGEFVDDPQQAVRDAGDLAREVLEALAGTIADPDRVAAWKAGDGSGATEDLRVALRQYRTLVDKLLEL